MHTLLISWNWLEASLFSLFVLVIAFFVWLAYPAIPRLIVDPFGKGVSFDGGRAYQHMLTQVEFGTRRDTGSPGWQQTGNYIIRTLQRFHWKVEEQEFEYKGTLARNIIGRAGRGPIVIVGSHYDTRRRADRDPNPSQRHQPVPGANDGASGVAVLLELARSLDPALLRYEVWLTFFDAEDNGQLDGWEWVAGSTYMANQLAETPAMVIVVDMVGDIDQQFYLEGNSDSALSMAIWTLAANLGYSDVFITERRHTLIDDHLPFARLGIPAVDIVDFDYPYWHTTQDTPDKVSPDSLYRVGHVLETFFEKESQ
jgi:glutaminyl-peptide cyclotransferase